MKISEAVEEELTALVTSPAPLIPPAPPEGIVFKQSGKNSTLLQLTSQQAWRDFSSLTLHEPEGLPE